MKNKKLFLGSAAALFMLLALVVTVTGCDNPAAAEVDSRTVNGIGTVAVREWRTFNSLSEMGAFLASAAANTKNTPYGVKLSDNVNTADFAGLGDESGLTKLFKVFKGKYVALDLSLCTGASVDGGSFDSIASRPDADKLVQLVLPEGLMAVGNLAFKNCTSLVSVTLPEGLQQIGDSAFRGCVSLAFVNFPQELKSIGQLAFDDTAISSAILPEGLISIGKWAFATESLTSITLPDSLLSIGEYAFASSSITAAIVGNRVTTLGRGVFQDCKSLQNVTLPSGLTTLGDYMFRNCVSLTSVILPANLQTIGGEVFFGCASLGAINLPQTLTSMGYKTFLGCINVTFSVTGGGTFEAREDGKVLVKNNNQIFAAPSLEGNVTLSGYTSVANFAFQGNTKITGVKFGEGFTDLGGQLFAHCTNLAAVDLPSTITSMPLGILDAAGYTSYEGSPVLAYGEPPIQTLTLRANVVLPVPYHLNDHARTVYVPASQVDAYRQDPEWTGCDIQPIE